MNTPVLPNYAISLEEIFWGGILVAVTMAMHGFGMLSVLSANGALKQRFERTPSFIAGLSVLVFTSWMILAVHLIEVFAWAGFFLWSNAVNTTTGASANASLCYYFALMDYTCLGCNYNLHQRWRLLEGMIAMVGLLTFAWSTGVLMTLAQDFQDQQLLLLKQKRDKRNPKHAATPPPTGKAPK
ncbi:MAG: hypothetical protein WCQ21_18025 [Verrucomicrobiota bacterium]|jgi:hypothetical protein